MLIRNKTQRILVVDKGIDKVTSLKLLPGINKVNDEAWKKALKNPMVKIWRDVEEWIDDDVKADSKPGPKKPDNNEFANIKESDAIKLISEIFDENELKNIISSEKREAVKEAAKSQLDTILQK
jgi:hypothetical protein